MFMITFLALAYFLIRPESIGKTFLAGCTGIIMANIELSATGLAVALL